MWEDLHRVKSSRAYITRSVKSGLALKCFILIGWQDFVGVTAVTYLFMPTHQTWSYLFVTFSKSSCVPVLTSTSSGCSYYTGPVSIDRARSSWRRLQVQTTNASKCIQCLRPSIPKDESLRKLVGHISL